MKVQVGFAGVCSCAILLAGSLLFACNSVSKSGLPSFAPDGSVKGADGSAGSAGGGSRSSGGASGNGGVTGVGGSVGSGGTSGGGGAIVSGGAIGAGGSVGRGGVVASGGTVGSGGSPSSGGRLGTGGNVQPGSGGVVTGGATGLGGAVGRGGNSGAGGVVGGGGSVGTGGTTVRDAAVDGNIPCGSRTCGAGQYCCSASCGLCVPMGAACIAIACLPDAGLGIDASACRAVPAADTLFCAGMPQQPHAYLCVMAALPSPCVRVSVGNVTDGYCCP